jgi:hypothetical protein
MTWRCGLRRRGAVEEVLAGAAVAGPPALPVAGVGESVLDFGALA